MNRTLSTECKNRIGEKVLLKGWMNQLRELGKINFMILRDRGGYIQLVIEDNEELEKINQYYVGTVVEVEGEVQESKQTDLGVEIINPKIKVLSPVTNPPTVEYNKDEIQAELPTILDNRPITIRNQKIQAIFKVQSTILKAFHDSMQNQGFVYFRNPVLLSSPSEGGADVFEVKYFDKSAYLCQSPQLFKQVMLGAYERVYTVTPVFRAEKHHTNRHLTELTHMDAEVAFIENMEQIFPFVEKVVRDIFQAVEKNNSEDLQLWGASLPKLPKGEFPRVKVREALEIIEKETGKSSKRDQLDFEPEDERVISKWANKEHGSDLLWTTHFHKDKNFYTYNNPEDPEESLSYDLLCRGIEWLSGTIRINDVKKLKENIKKWKLNEKEFEGYLQAFEAGIPPEAGFSFGLERITQKIFNFKNIREATLFPRDVERLAP